MTSSKSKDSFSLLLTDVLRKQCIKLVVTVTRKDVLSYTSDLKCTKKREALSWYDIVWNLSIEMDLFTQDLDWWELEKTARS